MIPPDKIQLVQQFSKARVGADQFNRGPDENFREVWWPKLGKRYVRNSDTPEGGYDTRDEAIEAARKYRSDCRAALEAGNG